MESTFQRLASSQAKTQQRTHDPDAAPVFVHQEELDLHEQTAAEAQTATQTHTSTVTYPTRNHTSTANSQAKRAGISVAGERDIDFWAKIPGSDIISRDVGLGIYRQHEYLLTKPHRIFGCSHPDGRWTDLEKCSPSTETTDLALSIQLADQKGPVEESDLTKFSTLVLKLAEALDRRFEFSTSVENGLAEAKKLESFCLDYDILVLLNVESKTEGGFNGRDIDRCVRGLDMELGEMNFYHRRNHGDHGAKTLFSLTNMHEPGAFDPHRMNEINTNGLSLFMNMANTYRPADAFLDMAQTAQDICQQFSAQLTDQSHNPLNSRGVDRIYREIKHIESEMIEQGIPPGSDIAAKLF